MGENENTWEEAAKKAILQEEGIGEVQDISETPIVPNLSAYASLGKATHATKGPDEEIKDILNKTGYDNLIIDNLPSKGRFYPYGTKISIRAARVEEIKDFSTLDENSPTYGFDVDDKLNNILVSCCKVEFSGKMGSYKDILEEDRVFIILSIRELTFVKGENKLTNNAVCRQCSHDNVHELRTNNLQYYDVDQELEKYYSEVERCYVIPTKSVGIIKLNPARIGVMNVITTFIKDKEEKKEKWDKSFLPLLPYYIFDWRGFDNKSIFNAHVDFQGWSATKFSLIHRLCERIKIGVKTELEHKCEKCGAGVTIPITFRNGIKSLFVISDISEELL